MKPPVDPVRVSARGREQLIKLKRQTGIEHWNVLCRWALCCSLREKSPPPKYALTSEGGVEIAWKVFGGEIGDTLALVVYQRAHQHGVSKEPEALAQYLRAHLERGLGYLASEREIKEIDSFLGRWLNNRRADANTR
jgi:DNA sulfur modification protein DndE